MCYISDVSKIFNKDLRYFRNLNYFIIDCLRYDKHPSHYNLEEVLKLIEYLNLRNLFLQIYILIWIIMFEKMLPKNVIPAYDGLSFKL